jgi:thymidylate kinase
MTDEELIAGLPESQHRANGIPDEEQRRLRRHAAAAAESALGDLLHPRGIRSSVLGAEWSGDVDIHLRSEPEPDTLEALGWLPIDGLLTALGSPGRGRWAIVEDGEILAAADLHPGPPPDPVHGVLERCRRRGEVRLREVLELRALALARAALPSRDAVLTAAADGEASLGGDALARWRTGRTRRLPVMLRGTAARRAAKRVLRRRGRRFGLALSGVDGSGKSTVARLVVRDLERLGIPSSVVWTRPGMRIAWLEPIARSAKRLLREDAAPGVLRVAADPDATLRSRRGPLGWTWAALVTRSFVRDVRRRSSRVEGVAVYDRHLLDAFVTLSFAYRGVDLRSHRKLVRRTMPPVAASFYMNVPPEEAAARKPGDAIGEPAIRRQLEAYATELDAMPEVVVLDATRPAEDIARAVLVGMLAASGRGSVKGEASATPRQG